jgi:hypothetical protein
MLSPGGSRIPSPAPASWYGICSADDCPIEKPVFLEEFIRTEVRARRSPRYAVTMLRQKCVLPARAALMSATRIAFRMRTT